MIRVPSTVALVTLVAMSALTAVAGSRSHEEAREPRFLGRGVSLSIDELHVVHLRQAHALIEMQVTLSNYGATPLKIDYLTFSLSGTAGERSLALLPCELHGQVASAPPLNVGVLAAGRRLVAVLYFGALSPSSRPIDFRVDLLTPDGQAISRSFLPLALR